MTWRAYLAVALMVLSFGSGWFVRDALADRDTARRDTADATSAVEAVKDARTDDLASQAGASPVEQQRVEQQAQAQTEFKYITREVIRYVAANPSPAGCGLSADGLRIWTDASRGRHAEPVDPAGPAVPMP